MAQLGGAAVCAVFVLIAVAGYIKGVPVFDAFVKGAAEGMQSCLRLLPTLVGLIVAISMLRATGFLEQLASLLRPLTNAAQLEPDLIPLMLLRPFSGSGSLSYVTELYSRYGADSAVARTAAVLASSTETTFYAAAVYFSGRGYRSLKYTIPAALCGDCAAAFLSVLAVRILL